MHVFCVIFSLLFAGASSASLRTSNGVTPVEKVVDLLKSLQAKVEAEGQSEAKTYDKYACFCKESADEKVYQIEKSDKKITGLTTLKLKQESELQELTANIQAYNKKILSLDSQIQSETETRNKDSSRMNDQEKECNEGVSRIEAAIAHLQNAKSAVSFTELQAISAHLTSDQQTKFHEAVSRLRTNGEPGKASTYDFGGDDVINLLRELGNTYKQTCAGLNDEEAERQNVHDKMILGKQGEKAAAATSKAEAERVADETQENYETTKAELTQETADRSADQAFLDELTRNCEEEAKVFDQRSQNRVEEVQAISGALDALKGASKNWGANKKLVGLTQTSERSIRPVMFLQQRSEPHTGTQRAVEFLSLAAARLGSSALSATAMRARVSGDHFVKVRSLIKDLVARLAAEAKAEEDNKAYCDRVMTAEIKNRDKAQAKLEKHATEISTLTAEEKSITQEKAELSKAIAEAKKALAEASELRNEQHEENKKTIQMSKDGAAAVDLALSSLAKYYGKAFLQAGFSADPQDPTSDRNGNAVTDVQPERLAGERDSGGRGNSIQQMLVSMKADFDRTFQQVTDNEEDDANAHTALTKKTNNDVDAKSTRIGAIDTRLTDLEVELDDATDGHKSAEASVQAAKDSLDKAKKRCVDGEETYKERVANREREIEACKKALAILESWKDE